MVLISEQKLLMTKEKALINMHCLIPIGMLNICGKPIKAMALVLCKDCPHITKSLFTQTGSTLAFLSSIMRYLAVQEISYRHLDENDDSAVNQGNYIQLLLLQLETNPTFKELRESI